MSYHDECPKCYGPSIRPSCKDCGYDVEDALRAKVDQLAAALAEWRKHDSALDCVACAALDAALAGGEVVSYVGEVEPT